MLISEQGTHINIVDDRVEDSLSNVNLGRDQLLRAMHRYGGNRALIVKVFSVRCHPPPPAPARPQPAHEALDGVSAVCRVRAGALLLHRPLWRLLCVRRALLSLLVLPFS